VLLPLPGTVEPVAPPLVDGLLLVPADPAAPPLAGGMPLPVDGLEVDGLVVEPAAPDVEPGMVLPDVPGAAV
jgi:hypothetical protein